MPDRFGLAPVGRPRAMRFWAPCVAVDTVLSDRQRRHFEAIVLSEVPLGLAPDPGDRRDRGERPDCGRPPLRCGRRLVRSAAAPDRGERGPHAGSGGGDRLEAAL